MLGEMQTSFAGMGGYLAYKPEILAAVGYKNLFS